MRVRFLEARVGRMVQRSKGRGTRREEEERRHSRPCRKPQTGPTAHLPKLAFVEVHHVESALVKAFEDLDAHALVKVVQESSHEYGLACATAQVIEFGAWCGLDLAQHLGEGEELDLAVDERLRGGGGG